MAFQADVEQLGRALKTPLWRSPFDECHCLGRNWIVMDAVTSLGLKLPPEAFVRALGTEPKMADAPVNPFHIAGSCAARMELESYAAKFGGTEHMLHQTHLGELMEHLISNNPRLTRSIPAATEDDIRRHKQMIQNVSAGLPGATSHAPPQTTATVLSAPDPLAALAKNAYQLFCAETKGMPGDAAQRWAAFKDEHGGTAGKYDEIARIQKVG